MVHHHISAVKSSRAIFSLASEVIGAGIYVVLYLSFYRWGKCGFATKISGSNIDNELGLRFCGSHDALSNAGRCEYMFSSRYNMLYMY